MIPAAPGAPAADWIAAHRDALRSAVLDHGAVLVRGLAVRDARTAAAVSRQAISSLVEEREPFAPRVAYEPGVYSSSVWPPEDPMCMHHEASYAVDPPGLQVLCCLVPPARGGATPLADAAAVLGDLPAPLVERFDRVGWELVRAHSDVVGVPWREAFGSGARFEVEAYCRANDVEWRWDADGGLRTRRRRRAVIRHPASGLRLWFNQVAFLNEWTMEPAVREYLTHELGADGLPFNTRYGDGEPLDRETVDLINDVYADHAVREPWRAGDVLIVDNLRMAHGRDPYEGPRRIVVALGDPVHVGGWTGRGGGQSKLSDRKMATSGASAEQARTVAPTCST